MGKAGISVGVCILWAVGGVRSAESDANGPLLAKPVKAPPLETLKLEKATELPAFHDAIYCPDADAVVLLRGRQLIRLSPKPPYEQAVTEDDRFAGAKLIGAFRSGQRFWVALHGAKLPEREGAWPVVYEVGLRRPVVPVPEGLKERGAGATEMTICAAAPRRGGLLVFTCGRQEDGWPRDGHRPVYFWLDIAHGGDMRRIQPGWDLDYLADGGRVAVFEGTYLGDFRRRPLIAMDMEDGEFLRQTPDRDKEDLAGLPPKASEEPVVRQTVGEWQAVTVDLRGTYNKHLWMRGAKDLPGKLRPVGRNIVVSALLGDGRCVFAVRGPPSPDGWAPGHTAFVYDCARDGAWDVLDGFETLAPVPQDLRRSVADEARVALWPGLGPLQAGGGLALLHVSRRQMDYRANVTRQKAFHRTFSGQFLITSTGRRLRVELFARRGQDGAEEGAGQPPSHVWVHRSGTFIVGGPKEGLRLVPFHVPPPGPSSRPSK